MTEDGEVFGVDDRPRCICDTCDKGFVQAWQAAIFPIIKKIFPGFIQGLSKDQMMDNFKSNIRRICPKCKVKSLSKDGSAFDGNQKKLVRKLIATNFYLAIKENLIKWWF